MSSRIVTVRLAGHHRDVTIIQAYAPDTRHTDDEVEEFYGMLEKEIETIDEWDFLLVMGDFNSKVGSDNRGYDDVMGRHGLGRRNERGERMLEFCQSKRLYVTNTRFYYRLQHRYTWTSPNGQHRNCIDNVLVRRRWKSSMLNTRILRSFIIETPHEFVSTRIRLKFRTQKKENINRRTDTDKLIKWTD